MNHIRIIICDFLSEPKGARMDGNETKDVKDAISEPNEKEREADIS